MLEYCAKSELHPADAGLEMPKILATALARRHNWLRGVLPGDRSKNWRCPAQPDPIGPRTKQAKIGQDQINASRSIISLVMIVPRRTNGRKPRNTSLAATLLEEVYLVSVRPRRASSETMRPAVLPSGAPIPSRPAKHHHRYPAWFLMHPMHNASTS